LWGFGQDVAVPMQGAVAVFRDYVNPLKTVFMFNLLATSGASIRTVHCEPSSMQKCSPRHVFFVSVTKFIRIGIADKNDNPPFFDKALYEAEVDENEDIQHTVLTVTAKDHDECEY
jgi:hypothetical protein